MAAERALHGSGFRAERIVSTITLPVRRAQSHLGDGRVHRARQPAADFLRRHRRRTLGLAGLVNLTQGEQASIIALQNGKQKALPFAIRCDGAGQENYTDGTPKNGGRSWRL